MTRPWEMRGSAYAGVGSRVTPPDVCAWVGRIALALAEIGWTVRTGGAEGADTAFANGAGRDRTALFLPWPNFNGWGEWTMAKPAPRAYPFSAQHHPAWSRLKGPVRSLHARNAHIVMGANMQSPASFVLCWTSTRDLTAEDTLRPTSKAGGTGQAIRIADAHRIPIWNLAVAEHAAIWRELTA